MYDYFVSPKTSKFTPWSELVADIAFNSAATPMGAVFVPTSETASLRFFLDSMVGGGREPGIPDFSFVLFVCVLFAGGW